MGSTFHGRGSYVHTQLRYLHETFFTHSTLHKKLKVYWTRDCLSPTGQSCYSFSREYLPVLVFLFTSKQPLRERHHLYMLVSSCDGLSQDWWGEGPLWPGKSYWGMVETTAPIYTYLGSWMMPPLLNVGLIVQHLILSARTAVAFLVRAVPGVLGLLLPTVPCAHCCQQ